MNPADGMMGLDGNARGVPRRDFAAAHFAWRGWVVSALFALLALARWRSCNPPAPMGLALVVLGAGYRFYAGRFISGHSNSRRLSAAASAFAGPYRYGRHPLYLSNLISMAGLILFANCLPWWRAALLFSIACAHHAVLARTEERYLASVWGETYRGYLRVTPRWLGRPPESRLPAAATADPIPPEREPAGLALTWRRQGANLGKSAAMALALWALAVCGR